MMMAATSSVWLGGSSRSTTTSKLSFQTVTAFSSLWLLPSRPRPLSTLRLNNPIVGSSSAAAAAAGNNNNNTAAASATVSSSDAPPPPLFGVSSSTTTNQELVQRRLEVHRVKRQARQRSIEQRVERNLYIKRLLHTNSSSSSTSSNTSSNRQSKTESDEFHHHRRQEEDVLVVAPTPPLYAVKVWVDEALRDELRLSGREKRGRVFIETSHTSATQTLKGLKQEIHAFFRALKKDTYLLRATLPRLSDDDGGSTILSPVTTEQALEGSWEIVTDDDVLKTFRRADSFFQNATHTLQRPSIQINVMKNPNAPPPPPPPEYLEGMSDPKDSETMTMLSFYAFPPSGIDNPEAFAMDLKRKWKPFQALGRVYVAQEGVNAQMSVPTNVLSNFMDCCRSIPQLGHYMENDINIDPQPLSQEEFAVAGVPINGQPAPPFRNLHVRVRTQVVADGLDKPLDWQSAGYDMPPMEWHAKIKEARDKRQDKDTTAADVPILLDCRNTYETNVGIFEGAEPLGTDNFRDSWDVLKDRLADTPKDAPIMTYCTGGIRCVKVGAYLTQELGFTNVSRLAGGIIAYDRTLNEKTKDEESMFKGTNFVFDGRLGRQITDDALANCVTCGAETSLVSNCRNENCHQRIVQCESCRTSYHGTCSVVCKNRIVNGAMAPRRIISNSMASSPEEESAKGRRKFDNLDDYSMGHSSPVPSIYKEIELNTQSYLASGSHMVSGESQGRLLTQLASMTRSGRLLELGTFTGYATACLLEGARNVGQILQYNGKSEGDTDNPDDVDDGGPYVLSMERDGRAFNLAAAHLKVIEEFGFEGEAAAEAACKLRSPNQVEDIKSDTVSVCINNMSRCQLLRVTDALATVEAMASGEVDLAAPFDIVFVDADKTRLLEYVEACLSSDRLLQKGGLIVVDNVLWKGLVVEASNGGFFSVADVEGTENVEARKNRRARKLATTMHVFNSAIAKDTRVEVLILPMRDGLSVIRKK